MADTLEHNPIRKRSKSDGKNTSGKKAKSTHGSSSSTAKSSTALKPLAQTQLEQGEEEDEDLNRSTDSQSQPPARLDTDDEDNHSQHSESTESTESSAFSVNVAHIPVFDKTLIESVSTHFPAFKEVVHSVESFRVQAEYFHETAAGGPLSNAERKEYKRCIEELNNTVAYANQCIATSKAMSDLKSLGSKCQNTFAHKPEILNTSPAMHTNPPIVNLGTTAITSPTAANTGLTVYHQQLRDHPGHLNEINQEAVKTFRRKWSTAKQQVPKLDRMVYITEPAKDMISIMLLSAGLITSANVNAWATMPDDVLFDHLLRLTAPTNESNPQEVRLAKKFEQIRIHLDFGDTQKGIQKLLQDIMSILRIEGLVPEGSLDTNTTIDGKLRKELLKIVVNNLKFGESATNRVYFEHIANRIQLDTAYATGPPTFFEFINIFKRHVLAMLATVQFNTANKFVQQSCSARSNEGSISTKAGDKSFKKRSRDSDPLHSPAATNSSAISTNPVCDGCGKRHVGGRDACFHKSHEDFNKHGTWAESAIGKFLKSKSFDSLQSHLKRNGDELIARPKDRAFSPKQDKNNRSGKSKPRQGMCNICTLLSSSTPKHNYEAICVMNNTRLSIRVLFDTGAESGSYVNRRVAEWLKSQGAVAKNIPKSVCSCFGECQQIFECLNVPLVIFDDNVTNNLTDQTPKIVPCWTIDNLPYDVVIGNKDIHKILPTQPNPKNGFEIAETLSETPGDTSRLPCNQAFCQPAKVPKSDDACPSGIDHSANTNIKGAEIGNKGTQPKPGVTSGKIAHVSELLDYEPAANGIPEKWDSLDEQLTADNLMVVNEANNGLPTKIYGDPTLQQDIRRLLVEFKDIFRTTVAPEPAKVPPMELKIDRLCWNNLKGTSGSPRVQSTLKNEEIRRQVQMMLDLGVIQESNASRYCQVLLTPKPNDKWRFCIDFQPLNSCCEGEGWNLPNIQQMLQRLGGHRPKLFGVMDLTSGYHQAPLSLASRIFTAFITFMGIFEWLRVPMGLKGAPSYFQRVLATVVLVGLIYTICELYIDDIIVHAREPDEFLSRLRKVFERLRKHNITLNPEKCSFGLPSVEYVGHTIDETGLSFSSEKLDEVLAIPPPQYAKELRSFLGLASYFRDHIQNLATMAKPLQDMLIGYEKKKKLLWTKESEQAFLNIKQAIRRCPKLFFINDDGLIFLHTDASDYGIGAYVFQIIDGVEYPIAFMSKTLSAEEMKWSTIEKECYAIVMALRKFEYLLRDRKFILRTDHENLTYINDPPSPKVRRWKIAIQEHDFHIEHIDGDKNVVADGFSRLLPITEETLCVLKEMRIPEDKYKVLSQFHNTHVGHHGVDRTLQLLRAHGHQWEYIREHVKKFISKCPCCQKMSPLKVAIQTRPYSLSAAKPMEILHMDSLHMEITDPNGNRYVLVLIDSCSRWIELFPIPDLLAETAAEKLVEHFGRFGQPSAIRSDNGTQFINQLHDELYRLTGIERIRTIPHSHEENGLVERANKEILRHVRSILFDRGIHKEWNIAIPMVQRILNSQVSKVTGATPAQLVLTNAINLDQGIYLDPTTSNPNNDTLSSWHNKRLSLQQQVLLKAQANMQAMENEKQLAAHVTPTEFNVGTYVLCSYPADDISKGNVGKLKTPWKGPMLVTEAQGDEYRLRDITVDKEYRVHISRIKPFYYDELKVDPFEIAAKDLDEETVEKIVDHTTHRLKSRMEFKVRWLGYDERHDLWLPWNQLRDNTLLHKYLFENGMKKLIPREHRRLQY